MVTRPRDHSGELRRLLEDEGAEVLEVPTIRIVPLEDFGEVDRALERLREYSWVVFTSRNGVEAFCARMEARGRGREDLAHVRLAAIGPGTAQALERRGYRVHLAPQEYRAEALVEELVRRGVRGVRILIPRAQAARPVLPEGLRGAGAEVEVVPVYRTVLEASGSAGRLEAVLARGVDAVTFTSGSTVRAFVELVGPEGVQKVRGALVACIGPVTAAAARECGLSVDVVARVYTVGGLVDALREAFAAPGTREVNPRGLPS